MIVQIGKATTEISGRDREVTVFERAITQKQAAVVIVTCLGMGVAGGPYMSSWRHRASFENYIGGGNCHRIGTFVKEWEMLHPSMSLGEPSIDVSMDGSGFAVVVKNGAASTGTRWTVIAEIYQTGDGG